MQKAMICMEVGTNIQSLPFWRRRKAWKEVEEELVEKIINPTNKMIDEMYTQTK